MKLPPRRTVAIKKEHRIQYSALVLLKKIHTGTQYNVLLDGNDRYLEPLLEFLMGQESIEIKDNQYQFTEQGQKTLTLFRKRYTDFLRNFDVYSAVDLQVGTFAFEKYWQIEEEDAWEAYLEESTWEDLRIAVCEYKNIDPLSMVFLSFVSEDRFAEETTSTMSGWQFDLTTGALWDEAIDIISTALRMEDLSYETDQGEKISGEAVLKDIIMQGAKLNHSLWEEEAEALRDEDPFALSGDAGDDRQYGRDPKYKSEDWDNNFFV